MPRVKNIVNWASLPWARNCQSSVATEALAVDAAVLPEQRVRGRTAAQEAMVSPSGEGGMATAQSADCQAQPDGPRRLGFKADMAKSYEIQGTIGKGGNSVVTSVQHRGSGQVYACKAIPKVPEALLGDERKIEERLQGIEREVEVMRQLATCLNVAKLEDVYEDDANVYLLLELCTGGELASSVGQRHYSERTVASYMRAILKTLAQCHAHRIIHRDIKPGNFLLETEEEDARIKAIDFGLAVFLEDGSDPTDIDMQGTPWFLAPEVLSSKWSPAADMWAAGITAHQLLTGRLPFDDKRNPANPALSAILRSILTDKLDFNRSYWQDISEEGRDFVAKLLERDPKKRPTALEALRHPWLKGDVRDRHAGPQLSLNVISRVQRYARNNNPLARNILELMVAELQADEQDSASDSPADQLPAPACSLDDKGRPLIEGPNADAVDLVLRYLDLDDNSVVSLDTVAQGLNNMGYRLTTAELKRILEGVGGDAHSVRRMSMIASQIDWKHLQTQHKDRWLRIVKRTFDAIDVSGTGELSLSEVVAAMEDRIPADEVEKHYYRSLQTAGNGTFAKRTMSFQTFMAMLRQPSHDSLEAYDDRLEGTLRTLRSSLDASNSSRSALSSRHGMAGPSSSCGLEGLAAGSDVNATWPHHLPSTHGGHSTRRGHDLLTVFERWEPLKSP